MSKLGRNPFEAKKKPHLKIVKSKTDASAGPGAGQKSHDSRHSNRANQANRNQHFGRPSFLDHALTGLAAQIYLLGLKSILYFKEILS